MIHASLIFVYKDGYVLAVKRSDNNLYGLPGGKVEPGEDELHAAVRECFEETGHVVVAYGPTAYTGLDDAENIVKTFRAEVVAVGEPITKDEGEMIWVPPETLITQSPWNAYNEAVLRHFGILNYFSETDLIQGT